MVEAPTGLERSVLRVGRAGLASPGRRRLPLPELAGLPGPLSLHSARRSALPGRAAPAGPMRRDVNGVTKSRFEV